jgi:hypothetical protein
MCIDMYEAESGSYRRQSEEADDVEEFITRHNAANEAQG